MSETIIVTVMKVLQEQIAHAFVGRRARVVPALCTTLRSI